MSNMYAIKDTTLTTLGDAVRNKTVKYISVEEKPENPNFEIEFDTSTFETYLYDDGFGFNFFYETQIDFKELLGDVYDSTKRLYCSYEYETNKVNTYVVYIQSRPTFEDRSNPKKNILVSNSNQELNGNGSLFIDLPTDNWYNTITAVRSFISTENDEIKVKIKVWACDANDKFIMLNKYTPLEMADVINGLDIIPGSALNITGNCNYRFANGGYDWLINNCGEKMTTKDINSMDYMFAGSNIETIPFEINGYSGQVNVMNCFNGSKIKQLPKMNIPKIGPLSNLFNNAYYLREIPDDKWNVGAYSGHTNAYDNHTNIFSSCYSLRYITPKLISNIWNIANGYYYSCYYGVFSNCYVLDKIVNLPVVLSGYTSNSFSNAFNYCHRLKDMIFETNEDGTAKIAGWKNQTLDLSPFVGYVYQKNNILNWNSGITADKEVKDDATYQELKDDPDWFSLDVNYSRYNRNSAIETINSLPDCSATGTNTIKFKGQAGALTDGGAINTLTEEEIAVASAKGWTVSFT